VGTLAMLLMLSHAAPALAPAVRPPSTRDPATACIRCEAVIQRVLPLLPRRPLQVIVLDTEHTTELLKAKLAGVDGFITKGDPAVYLRMQSETFQAALAGPGIWDYALAITIWHEMAHLDGADEHQAQEKEEALWREFIVNGRVDNRRGMAYLALLRKRHQL
jgi:hypothetical protein